MRDKAKSDERVSHSLQINLTKCKPQNKFYSIESTNKLIQINEKGGSKYVILVLKLS